MLDAGPVRGRLVYHSDIVSSELEFICCSGAFRIDTVPSVLLPALTAALLRAAVGQSGSHRKCGFYMLSIRLFSGEQKSL